MVLVLRKILYPGLNSTVSTLLLLYYVWTFCYSWQQYYHHEITILLLAFYFTENLFVYHNYYDLCTNYANNYKMLYIYQMETNKVWRYFIINGDYSACMSKCVPIKYYSYYGFKKYFLLK